MIHDFLPVSRQDMKKRGIEQLDFVYISGDAYVDHPSFGLSLIHISLEWLSQHLHPPGDLQSFHQTAIMLSDLTAGGIRH